MRKIRVSLYKSDQKFLFLASECSRAACQDKHSNHWHPAKLQLQATLHVQKADCLRENSRNLCPPFCILPAPATSRLSSVPTYHCDMLLAALIRSMSSDSTSGGAYAATYSTESAHSGANASRWLYHLVTGYFQIQGLSSSQSVCPDKPSTGLY